MNDHHAVFHLKIEAPILRPEPVKCSSIPLDSSETLTVEIIQVLLCHLELIKEFELLKGTKPGDLGSTDFVEDDLKHSGIVYFQSQNPNPNLGSPLHFRALQRPYFAGFCEIYTANKNSPGTSFARLPSNAVLSA